MSNNENGLLKALFNNIPTPVIVIDQNTIVRIVNSAFQDIFDTPEIKAIGNYCGNAMNCEFPLTEGTNCGTTTHCNKCNLRNSFIRSFATDEITREKITKSYFLKGHLITKHIKYTTVPIRFENEEMLMIILDDVTELEERNLQLENLNQKKNEFLRIASHDLRNPLTVIYSFAELLIDNKLDLEEKKIREFLEIILKSSKFSLGLLNELLDYSAIESGKVGLKTSVQNFQDLLKENVEMHKLFGSKKNIAVQFGHVANIPLVEFDRNKIEQVLNNLLSNALKYSNCGTTITIGQTENNGFVVISVTDEGPGISPDDMKRLFKPFQKGSARTTAGETSTGLGLAITKNIIEAHGGDIWVESQLGKGSTFYFKIPVSQPKQMD
jgi:signal transduction histidine kinase